ncbi:hypothetical protein Pmar_PMAR027431 [Perkinsus marinus ATCC 50983]|uniref:Uncharacterized protein n=1 Tax=Perkinsus marinus (strain ATCC 50983 / TXsc) TaxID=423536 RepID=C5KLS5_PERM5|nr:hypothetical protein Pmar_PMAR027431 [Perkinsus marinus ATCC 50983]EER14569.1 hypothetical protein Pmar_PMAR027431 [Perkinsus marinus ATCC 50983]|eukprot:XP_002782774.1 hypothetical protein Pmar_PMAR027431 [Perkinsus marinus ATCC 50983]
MPSRHPFPSRHCLQLQFSGTALDYAKHDGEGGGSIGIGDSILASINGGRLYTLVNVEECQRLDVGGEVKKAMNDAAAAASSTYALVLSYPPDSEAKHLQKECDITSVLSPGEAHINGDWMLFRPGDKVYAPSSIDNGRFLPAVIAEDHRTGEPTEAHETLPVAFTRGGGGKKIERVPRSFIFRRSSMQDEGDQSSVSPGAEKKRGTKRGGGEKGEGQGVACRKHRKVATSTSDQLEASDSPGHKKVPLLEELGLYDDDEEKGEGSSTRMTDEEWKVVEKSLHILRRFGIDALVNSEKREVFPVPSTQKVGSTVKSGIRHQIFVDGSNRVWIFMLVHSEITVASEEGDV